MSSWSRGITPSTLHFVFLLVGEGIFWSRIMRLVMSICSHISVWHRTEYIEDVLGLALCILEGVRNDWTHHYPHLHATQPLTYMKENLQRPFQEDLIILAKRTVLRSNAAFRRQFWACQHTGSPPFSCQCSSRGPKFSVFASSLSN